MLKLFSEGYMPLPHQVTERKQGEKWISCVGQTEARIGGEGISYDNERWEGEREGLR